MFWLSSVFGGLIMKLHPEGGLFCNRIYVIANYTLMFAVYYTMLKTIIPKNKAITLLFISLLFFQHSGFETLNYDSFSILFYSIAIYFFYKGILKNSNLLLICGAFICGMMFYFRITNLANIALLALTLYLIYLQNKNILQTFKKSLLLITGYNLGHALILLSMYLMNHLNLFAENLQFVLSMGQDSSSTHGMIPLMKQYARGWVIALFMGAAFISLLYLYHRISKTIKLHNYILHSLLIIVSISLLIVLIMHPNATWSKVRYIFYGLIAYSAIAAFFISDIKLKSLLLFGSFTCFLFPLGSDSGIEKVYYAIGLSGPIVFFILNKYVKIQNWSLIKKYLLGIFITSCLVYGFTNTYFDEGSRLNKTYSVKHSGLKNIYTTKERAKVIDELTGEIRSCIKKDDYLLAISGIPMIHYLSQSKPYLGTSWPKLYYAPAIFKSELEKAFATKRLLPVIIMQKMATGTNWPMNITPDYLKPDTKNNKFTEHYQIVFEFMTKNSYSKHWENDMFIIYLPKNNRY